MHQEKLKVINGMVGHNIGFDRIRRITGYLVGSIDRFNNAKRAELNDRVVHLSFMDSINYKK